MLRRIAILLTVVLCGFWAAGTSMAGDAAMVLEVRGPVLMDSGPAQGQAVQLMDFLAPGDRIKLGGEAVLVLNYFASGQREEISGPGSVLVGETGGTADGAAIKTAKMDFVPPPVMASAGDAQHAGVVALRDTMRESPEKGLINQEETPEVALLCLNGTAARGVPLTFRWRPVEVADTYVFEILNPQGERLVKAKTKAAQPEFVYDQDGLSRGIEYVWKVTALAAGVTVAAGEGRFYLLPEASLSAVTSAEDYIRANYQAGASEAEILLALVYQSNELNDEAKAVLLSLRQKHPGNVNIISQLKMLRTNYHFPAAEAGAGNS